MFGSGEADLVGGVCPGRSSTTPPGELSWIDRAELRDADPVGVASQGYAWKIVGELDLVPQWWIRVRDPAFEVLVVGWWETPAPERALPEE